MFQQNINEIKVKNLISDFIPIKEEIKNRAENQKFDAKIIFHFLFLQEIKMETVSDLFPKIKNDTNELFPKITSRNQNQVSQNKIEISNQVNVQKTYALERNVLNLVIEKVLDIPMRHLVNYTLYMFIAR